MYFDSKAIAQLLRDEKSAQDAAPVIAATTRRFTSPLAVVEAILALGPTDDPAGAEGQVREFLDRTGIEIRDMPPTHRLIEAASQPRDAQAGALEVLNRACAEYYEVETFSLADLAQEQPEAGGEKTDEQPNPPAEKGEAGEPSEAARPS